MLIDVPLEDIVKIPGWFQRRDMQLFRVLLEATQRELGGGDLAELGVYLGKSAALIGCLVQPGETFTVIDLFEGEATTAANQAENDQQYRELSQEAFERWYGTVHEDLPAVVKAPSEEIVKHASLGTHRFVHIDASHLYEHVVGDIAAARTLLKPDGVVVFDDYRAAHTPGVAAAVWRATAEGLTPFAVTLSKLYATWGDPAPWLAAVKDWIDQTDAWDREIQWIGGAEVVRPIAVKKEAPAEQPDDVAPEIDQPSPPEAASGRPGLLGRLRGRG